MMAGQALVVSDSLHFVQVAFFGIIGVDEEASGAAAVRSAEHVIG